MAADEAGQYSFTVYKGQPFHRVFRRKVDGVATDWTGYTGLCQIRAKPGATAVLAEAAITFDVDRTTGNFYLDLTEEQVEALATNLSYAYDVRMTKDGATTIYLIKGTISVATRVSLPS